MNRRHHRRTLAQTFAWPLLLALTTLAALVAGFTGDGVADGFAVIGLASPLVIGLVLAGWK